MRDSFVAPTPMQGLPSEGKRRTRSIVLVVEESDIVETSSYQYEYGDVDVWKLKEVSTIQALTPVARSP